MGKFNEKVDDGFFLDYSIVAKGFRVLTLEDKKLKKHIMLHLVKIMKQFLNQSKVVPSSSITSQSINPLPPQDKWSREKHVELVNIIGEPLDGITTRSRVKDSKSALSHEYLYVNFLFETEPKRLNEALKEEGWVIAMQEELNQFKRNKVWTRVLVSYGKTIIGTKWIFRNKIDKNGVVKKNKARLVAQGFRQEEEIDYDETFSCVARLEAIGIFLAYSVYMGFMVYQIDVKSAFLHGKI
nr:retrovirus-related Pol polyprotein from transposon TNT 1-94 [Tanacetum cinerariifolium]